MYNKKYKTFFKELKVNESGLNYQNTEISVDENYSVITDEKSKKLF